MMGYILPPLARLSNHILEPTIDYMWTGYTDTPMTGCLWGGWGGCRLHKRTDWCSMGGVCRRTGDCLSNDFRARGFVERGSTGKGGASGLCVERCTGCLGLSGCVCVCAYVYVCVCVCVCVCVHMYVCVCVRAHMFAYV